MLGLDNPLHILLVLLVVLLVFGAKRLPEMGKSLGEGIRGFKGSIGDDPSVHAVSPLEPAQSAMADSAPAADRPAQPVA